LLWVGAIVALVVSAVVISYAADDNTDARAEPPVDTGVFCQTAIRFQSFNQINLDGGGSDQLKDLAVVATQLGSLSPTAIQKDFSAVGDALQNVASAIDVIPPDDPAAIGVATQKLDDELGQVAAQADEAADYIERWCGPLDELLTGTSDSSEPIASTSSTEPPAGGPVGGTVEPPG
jgi:hypothetical protein